MRLASTFIRRSVAAAGLGLSVLFGNAASAHQPGLPSPYNVYAMPVMPGTKVAPPARLMMFDNLLKIIREDHFSKERVAALGEMVDHLREEVEANEKTAPDALNEILRMLDPHSFIITRKESPTLKIDLSGWRAAGMTIVASSTGAAVSNVFYNGNAQDAGLQEGDVITQVNGQKTAGLSEEKISGLMCGSDRQHLRVVYQRAGAGTPRMTDITCSFDQEHVVTGKVIANTIGYIYIERFAMGSYADFSAVLDDIQTKNPQLTGYILDMRNNPGGLLGDAYGVLDDFLDSTKPMIMSVTRYGAEPKNAKFGDRLKGKPLIALVNGGSFSASELVAFALQYYGRATIMGLPTGGKGTMQMLQYFDKRGVFTTMGQRSEVAMTLTYGMYTMPDGSTPQLRGVVPDIEVPGTYTAKRIPNPERAAFHPLDNPQGAEWRFADRMRLGSCTPTSGMVREYPGLKSPDGTPDQALICAVEKLLPPVVKIVPAYAIRLPVSSLRASALQP